MSTIIDIKKSDVHERYNNLKQTYASSIEQMVQKIVSEEPFGKQAFYIFAHRRTNVTEGKQRLIWQPRLLKPSAQDNSMLFRVNPREPDNVEVIWIIPDESHWNNYSQKGKKALVGTIDNPLISDSIHDFKHNRKKLEAPHPDDPSGERAAAIYKEKYPNLFKKE